MCHLVKEKHVVCTPSQWLTALVTLTVNYNKFFIFPKLHLPCVLTNDQRIYLFFGVVSIFVFVSIFPAELQILHLISSASFSKCSKIRAEPCKVLHVHWKRADPVLSGLFGHGNTSGCSISSGGGELPPRTVVQEPCTSQVAIKLSKQGLPGLQESCSWPSTWKDCHSSSRTHGVSSPEHGQSAGGVSSRWVCTAYYMVYTHFHCLSVLGKRAVFLALSPGFTAVYIHTRFLPWLVWSQRK